MSLSSYRKYFPISSTDIYLNHAAVSPLSTKVVQATERILQMRSSGEIEVFHDAVKKKKNLKKYHWKYIRGF